MPLAPEEAARQSLADLETAWLRKSTFITDPAKSLEDLRAAMFGPSELDFWASSSGLLPVAAYTLTDHKITSLRQLTGLLGTVDDLARAYYAQSLP
jgi:hypothetical protein